MAINRIKDPPTWLKMATTLESPQPPPTDRDQHLISCEGGQDTSAVCHISGHSFNAFCWKCQRTQSVICLISFGLCDLEVWQMTSKKNLVSSHKMYIFCKFRKIWVKTLEHTASRSVTDRQTWNIHKGPVTPFWAGYMAFLRAWISSSQKKFCGQTDILQVLHVLPESDARYLCVWCVLHGMHATLEMAHESYVLDTDNIRALWGTGVWTAW